MHGKIKCIVVSMMLLGLSLPAVALNAINATVTTGLFVSTSDSSLSSSAFWCNGNGNPVSFPTQISPGNTNVFVCANNVIISPYAYSGTFTLRLKLSTTDPNDYVQCLFQASCNAGDRTKCTNIAAHATPLMRGSTTKYIPRCLGVVIAQPSASNSYMGAMQFTIDAQAPPGAKKKANAF